MQSLIIGEFSFDEKTSFDKVLHASLGRSLDIAPSDEPVLEMTERSSTECESGMPPDEMEPTLDLKEVKFKLHKLVLDKLDQTVIITHSVMEKFPKSKYRPADYLDKLTAGGTTPLTDKCDIDTIKEFSSLDETVQYWPLDKNQQLCLFPNIILSDTLGKKVPSIRSSVTYKVNINVHGIRKCQQHYYFKCTISKCMRSFDKINDWNSHHLIMHKTKVKCMDCTKMFHTLSAHCAHQNQHATHKHICKRCSKTFAYLSGLNQHKLVHQITFALLLLWFLSKAYKWPWDLTRHIKHHVQKRIQCPDCDKTFKEDRLLKQH